MVDKRYLKKILTCNDCPHMLRYDKIYTPIKKEGYVWCVKAEKDIGKALAYQKEVSDIETQIIVDLPSWCPLEEYAAEIVGRVTQ